MSRLLKRIQVAIGAGAALCAPLAGCKDKPMHPQGTDAGTYELDQLGCFGPVHDGGYFGQCCVDALCYTPTSGACLAQDDPTLAQQLVGFPPGSGSCGCATMTGPSVVGPYNTNPANPEESDGTCCYLVGSISCEGRPLCVDGHALTAAVVVRGDWLLG